MPFRYHHIEQTRHTEGHFRLSGQTLHIVCATWSFSTLAEAKLQRRRDVYVAMPHKFQDFIERLLESVDAVDLSAAMAIAAGTLEIPNFGYLALPRHSANDVHIISSINPSWIERYLENHYDRVDPVIRRAIIEPDSFEWCVDLEWPILTKQEQRLFDEAAAFGIRCGFTIPVHDGQRAVAVVTFVTDEYHPQFYRRIEKRTETLQLLAFYFHAHARRILTPDRSIDGISLSPREFECLEWSARGKSAWEIGRILGISRRTAAFHLENAKNKLGVRSICQAVARLSASRPHMH